MIHQTDTPKTFSAVPGHPRLYRREGGTYYLRAKVPDVLRPIIKKTEIRQSLRTKDYREALKLVKLESLVVDRQFEKARLSLNKKPLKAPSLSREEIAWIVSDYFVRAEAEAQERADQFLTQTVKGKNVDDTLAPDIIEGLVADITALGRYPTEDTRISDDGSGYLDHYLANEGARLSIARGSEDYDRLLIGIRAATIENMNRTVDRLSERRPVRRDFPDLGPHTVLAPPPRSQTPFGEFLDEYMEFKKSHNAETTPSSYKLPIRILREVIGEHVPLASITRQQVEEACKQLMRVPVNMTQRYPKHSVREAIASAERHSDSRIITTRTASNYYMLITAIFNYAVEDGLIISNPAKSRKLREMFKQKKKPVQRALFTSDELLHIFSAPLYTGCVDDDRGYKKKGDNVFRRGRFWVPLIALFQGLRCNEACQLYVQDVQNENGVWFLNVREELDEVEATEKRLKNSSSWRKVPLHPEILEIGFLEFVDDRKRDKNSKRLFPSLKLGEKVNRYSHVFSKWFGQFLISACGHRPKGTFHSFRHHFRSSLMNEGVPDGVAQKLGGWAVRDAGVEQVYRHADLRVLNDAISRVNYPVDLTHLYPEKQR